MKSIKQAVILAGGRGQRLKPLTDNIPKPMAPINGKPFLDYLINSFIKVGIKKILILVGYKSEIIIDYYKNIKIIDIEFSFCDENCETGKRISEAYDKLDKNFLLAYGDNYWDVELEPMIKLFSSKKVYLTTTVFSNESGTSEYGYENNVQVLDTKRVKKYDKERKAKSLNGVDIGYFLVDKNLISPKLGVRVSFENNILPNVIKKNGLYAYCTENQYYYITNMESLSNFERYIKKNNIIPNIY